ncbi:uncharacterized protein LOC110906790 [Helianthus annuus]|uniref:uncharacterized protein LOC110906790 n=1 Tax=Helianthus annuus TaxID=4232 RepID=UPI000B9036F8|nr:uncharacterized protein LOC110906790 [Helianthus annuus]
MDNNRDRSLEDLGFRSFSDRMHEDVFITSKGSVNVQDLRQTSSLQNKPVRIDGNPLIPRRGVVSKDPKVINVIDELEKITVPVQPPSSGSNSQDYQHGMSSEGPDSVWGYGGGQTAANVDAHANPSLNNVVKDMAGFSYADKVKTMNSLKREVNFRKLDATETVQDADVLIPREVIQKVQDKFENVLYGYFLGNRLPFPVVEYYAKNVWAKHGFAKIMMNSEGFFFFKFDSKEGMMKVLEGGPWLIRKVPLFLNVWSPSVNLKKECIKSVPVWVKFHNVPIAIYTDDGLSLLASKLGTPKRLDGYTADMCVDNWGRSSFARAMIEINADNDLKDFITVAIPKLEEDGYITEKVKIEYEWKPQRCSVCCVFGHNDQTCPKNIITKAKQVVIDDEGFITDTRKQARIGVLQKKQKAKFVYRPKGGNSGASSSGTKHDKPVPNVNANVATKNSFEALSKSDGDVVIPLANAENMGPKPDVRNKPNGNREEEVVEVVPTEMSKFMSGTSGGNNSEGASTPGFTESHIHVNKLSGICSNVFRSWSWTSNGGLCSRGTRIILGWNTDVVDIMVISQSDQVMHTQIHIKADNRVFFCSFVYAENKALDRRILWEDLCNFNALARDKPWLVLGDFNVALNMEDCLSGPSHHTSGMREFFDCVKMTELLDIPSHGIHFTWNQKPREGIGVMKKLDRVMSNLKFMGLFPYGHALFKSPRLSDHSPCIVKFSTTARVKPKPFKFPNFIVTKEEFRQAVSGEWAKEVQGHSMFAVVKKMRNLKPIFCKILFRQGNLHERVASLRLKLDHIQQQVDANPLDLVLRDDHAKCLRDFQTAAYDEECFLKQKAKVEWLCAGDTNTAFFHKCVKSRHARNKIFSIMDVQGNRYEGDQVPTAFLNHYTNFLGREDRVDTFDIGELFVNTLSDFSANHMVRSVTRDEVKKAMFGIGENKAPGPDGYTSAFFKHSWDVVGDQVTNAVLDFFENGQMLKQINHTIIALVPKKDSPNSVQDYRPISCCNVLFKCISKIITDRIKGSLDGLVSINQSAFVPGRKITDNILLTQELMHNYHIDRGPSRCALKIDIHKAYDTVNWSFLEAVLLGFGFHSTMVRWIKNCVSTVSYSPSINGELHGYFCGKRGLRQGDPLSPYLFTLVMEVLSLLLQRASKVDSGFRFHAHCAKQKIINVSFADDLFIFAHADCVSVKLIRDALQKFTRISGLVPSAPKSPIFFCNVQPYVKDQILGLMPFQEGSLPVRYLGVPLISSRLAYSDCKILVERVQRRIDNWLSKSLSFAGRLQLINSVIAAMYSYWASVFMLPVRIVKDLEKCMRRFLWNGGVQGSSRSKVAWKDVCLPKIEGGLGIRSVVDVNKALISSHAWSIINNRRSLWVSWIHTYKLKGISFWEVKCSSNPSWGWRKILALRNQIRPYVWKTIQSGQQTNAWSDNWCSCSPIRDFISPRRIHNAGFNLNTTVADLIDSNGQWKWPVAWYDLFPVLLNISAPTLVEDVADRSRWKDYEGKLQHFHSFEAWNSFRMWRDKVTWVDAVWFSQCIPRHSFHVWLVINNKLKTQDRMSIWEAGSATNLILMCCPLCFYDRDSRDHLFFQCPYASEVWKTVREWVDMGNVNNTWSSVLDWIENNASSKQLNKIVCKILLGATTYFIWQERNNRLFSNLQRSPAIISQVIFNTVRLKLMGFSFASHPDHLKIRD